MDSMARKKPILPDLLNELSTHRSYLMGIAIILVIVFHCFSWVFNPIGVFNIGYIGVDIFLFLSGYGLSFSYEKNPLPRFYANRFTRIFPLYTLAVIIGYIICFRIWSVKDFLLNLLCVNYYINGPFFDWYVPTLIGLYLLIPLLYYLGQQGWLSVAILFIIVFGILFFFDIPDHYSCALSRLPIFVYGIAIRKCPNFKPVFILGLLLFFPCYLWASHQLATCVLAIPLIVTCVLIAPKIGKLYDVLSWCGKYSLELYLANVLTWYILNYSYTPSGFAKLGFYFFLQILFSGMLIVANGFLQNIIHNKLARNK